MWSDAGDNYLDGLGDDELQGGEDTETLLGEQKSLISCGAQQNHHYRHAIPPSKSGFSSSDTWANSLAWVKSLMSNQKSKIPTRPSTVAEKDQWNHTVPFLSS
jgi:hypothetical protein